MCVSHAEQVKAYVRDSRWSLPTSSMEVKPVVSSECASVGDCLRLVDRMGLIEDGAGSGGGASTSTSGAGSSTSTASSDFVLCYGDLVSNMNLAGAIQRHRERRIRDKSCVLTMVLRRLTPEHPTSSWCEGAVIALDDASGDCLAWEPVESEVPSNSACAKKIRFDATLLRAHRQVTLAYDLMDCQIDICSPQVI